MKNQLCTKTISVIERKEKMKLKTEQKAKDNNSIKLDWNLVEDIYLNQYKHLKKVAYRRLDSKEKAEDAVQDTMEVICKNVNKENNIYNIDAWVYTILKYKCLNLFKRKYKMQYFPNDALEEFMIQEELDTITDINLYNELNNLEKMEREIIIYKFIYGFKYTEISKICGCSYGKIKRKINKSLETLKSKLVLEEIVDKK